MNTLIPWKNSYSVGVEEIDEQHKKLFFEINKLYSAVKEEKDTDLIMGNLLSSLTDYINYHFGTEEKYFEECGFEEKEKHLAKHQEFIDRVQNFKNEFILNNNFMAFKMLDFLREWIVDHVTSEDREYMECFKECGLK